MSFRLSWNSVQKIDNTIGALGPHYFAPYKREILEVCDEQFKSMVDSMDIPVFKLSNQKKMPLEQFDSIQYLFETLKK